MPYNGKQIRLAYKAKHNLKHKNHVILLMIADGKKWHYLLVKKLPTLFKGIKSNHDGYFYLNCLHSFKAKNKSRKECMQKSLLLYKNVWRINNILKHNHGEKSMKVPFIIYADLGVFT